MSDAVLVVGGGIAGLRAALDLSHAGARVIVVENRATIGGKLASLLEEGGGVLDLPDASWLPTLSAVAGSAHIEVLTLADVVGLSGEPGEFAATIRTGSRFVSDVCDRCNVCRQVCPVVRPNEYDAGLSFRKAIFSPLRDPVPASFVIDIESCLNEPPNYIPCQRCVQNCHVQAINFDTPLEKTITRDVGSVILAAGFDLVDAASLDRFGYGTHPDIVTSMELERLFAPSGATGGYVEKPSSEHDPDRVLIVVTDSSDFTWTYSARHARRLFEQAIENITLLYETPPDSGKTPETFLSGPIAEKGKLIHGTVDRVHHEGTGPLRLDYRTAGNGMAATAEYDMIVVATAVRPPAGLADVAGALGIRLGGDGFVRTMEKAGSRVATSRPGVYACGCVTGPKNIRESLTEAGAAAVQALPHLGRRFQTAREAEKAEEAKREVAFSKEDMHARMAYLVESLIALGEKRLS